VDSRASEDRVNTHAHTVPQCSVLIDGKAVLVPAGTTILQAVEAAGIRIPTLCHHPNLPPIGVCRLCVVDVEVNDLHRQMAACHAEVQDGMTVHTATPELERARRFALELQVAEHPAECLSGETGEPCELRELARRFGVTKNRLAGEEARYPLDESSPVMTIDLNRCILCRRCTRACSLVQGQDILWVMGRGDRSRVSPALSLPLRESGCVSCGQCLAHCPTGAIRDRRPLQPPARPVAVVTSVCAYCGCGCRLDLNVSEDRILRITSNFGGPANRGSLCAKGRFGYEFVDSPDRLTLPRIRRNGRWDEATWDQALDLVAGRLRAIRDRHGPDALAVLSSAKATNEENYLIQKFARSVLGTNNVDHCARL
jgi:predicted molibdopterin-dependent oxidoreductase YjgC